MRQHIATMSIMALLVLYLFNLSIVWTEIIEFF